MQTKKWTTLLEVFITSTKLGLTSFGGPVAHLGYFHEEYIRRKKWLDERSYADLVSLCQFLPGPASSQVGIGIGIMRAGLLGGVAAWSGFTLPSALALVLFALFFQNFDVANTGWIHGLKIVAVAVVAHAILGMGQNLTPDRHRITLATIVAVITLIWPSAISQAALIIIAGAAGIMLFRNRSSENISGETLIRVPIRRSTAIIHLSLFFILLLLLPLLRHLTSVHWLAVFDSFYRTGSLVFGGGHVVLPLLEKELVPSGWMSREAFLAGYGAAQAVPGPLFTFASYAGAVMGGWFGAGVATIGIFLPAFLLVAGTLPFWDAIRRKPHIQGAITGVNAAVVGILLAAFYDPIWLSSVRTPLDFSLASILFVMLAFWNLPPWIVVLTGALGGTVIQWLA